LVKVDDVTVTITAAMDTVLADAQDHDPIFGISDGNSFIGFLTLDNSVTLFVKPVGIVKNLSGRPDRFLVLHEGGAFSVPHKLL